MTNTLINIVIFSVVSMFFCYINADFLGEFMAKAPLILLEVLLLDFFQKKTTFIVTLYKK